MIARLECALAEQRDNSAELRNTVDELRFQNNTLETSYSKQLKDARERCDVAEDALAELQVQLDEVGGKENIFEVLATTRADLDRITAERDRLLDRLRQRATGRCPPEVGKGIDSASIAL